MPFTPEQLKERQRFLGGSEAAAALGLSPFFTPLDLYRSKIGEGEPIEETLPMLVGIALEPVTLQIFEREKGLKVGDRQLQVVDARYPWRRSTLDGRASDGWLVEAKASGQWQNWGKEIDEVPAPIIYQCQHQLACEVHAPGVYVPVILGQRQFRCYEVRRDPELIAMLTTGEQAFMDLVAERRPPAPMTSEDLKVLYPYDTGKKIEATDYIAEVAYQLALTKKQRKEIEQLEESQAFEVKEFMRDAAILVDKRGNPLFTYKAQTENRIDVTALRREQPLIAEQYSRESTVRKLLNKQKV